MGVFTGCATNIASAFSPDELSPGAIVSLYGSKMGPPEGAAFQLENGRLPATLAGTRVLVNGEPVPLLMVSYWQVNAILPYSLDPRGRPRIQVVTDSEPGNELANSFTKRAWISLFRLDDSMAAALNEDGTLNSPENPAAKGSAVMLFGTGGGTTTPPSVAGEVTPLAPRQLDYGAGVEIPGGPKLTVEYAGAAPGLVAGVIQINVRLPEVIPEIEGYPPDVLPLRIETPGIAFTELVTIAVSP